MNTRLFSRRRLLLASVAVAPLAMACADAILVEPGWVKVKRVRIGGGRGSHRVAHITDIHYKGDRAHLESIVRKINTLTPDFVCFTGDLIEEGRYLPEALELLSKVKAPLYGVPGNHDYWCKTPFDSITRCFASTGGAWLLDSHCATADGCFTIWGAAFFKFKKQPLRIDSSTRNVFLMHYPAWIEKLGTRKLDLILAGHSHGGQVRIPFYGGIHVPFGTENYEVGLFETPAGPLYVNPGIGWYPWPIRFNCRPEITLFEL